MSLFDQARAYLSRRRTAYVKTFTGPFGGEVLEDLAKFCRATETTFHPDPRVHAVAEGRKEVWLRIQRHLQLSDDQLWALHAPAQPPPTSRRNEDE
jgi:hypothetical protein